MGRVTSGVLMGSSATQSIRVGRNPDISFLLGRWSQIGQIWKHLRPTMTSNWKIRLRRKRDGCVFLAAGEHASGFRWTTLLNLLGCPPNAFWVDMCRVCFLCRAPVGNIRLLSLDKCPLILSRNAKRRVSRTL